MISVARAPGPCNNTTDKLGWRSLNHRHQELHQSTTPAFLQDNGQ